MRRIAIIGSRPPSMKEGHAAWNAFSPLLDAVAALVRSLPLDAIVVSGGAKGVDMKAQFAAQERGMLTIECPISPEAWRVRGKSVAAIRNQLLVDIADDVYAFWFRKSSGTAMTIDMARDAVKLRNVVEVL